MYTTQSPPKLYVAVLHSVVTFSTGTVCRRVGKGVLAASRAWPHLRQNGETRPEVVQPHVSDVDAVNKDGTPSRLHQSEQRQSQGRFACPCPAHNAHLVTSDKKPTSKSFLPFLFPLRPTNPHTAPLLSSVPIGTVKTQRLSSPLYLQVQYKHSASPLLCTYRHSTNTAPLLSSVPTGTVQTQRLSSSLYL